MMYNIQYTPLGSRQKMGTRMMVGNSMVVVHPLLYDKDYNDSDLTITGLLFSKGKKVEVSLEKVESSVVWFPAIVQEDTGDGSFLVEYQCIGKNDEPESVKVKVDSLHIRPSPPQLKGKNYDLLEKVDAYIEFSWRTGVLTRKLVDNKYCVSFLEPKKEMEFNQSEIRPHMEWKEGNWFSTSQDVSVVAPGSKEALKVNSEEGAFDSLNSLEMRMEWSAPSSTKPSTIKSCQKEKAKLVSSGTEDSTKEMEHADNSDLPLLPTEEGIHVSSTSTNGGARTNNLEQSEVDLPSENFSRGKRARTKRKKVDELEYRTPQRLRSVGRPPKSQTEPQALAGDKRVGELEHHTPEESGGKSKVLPIAQMTDAETPGDRKDDAVKCTEENLVQKDCVTEVPRTCNPAAEILPVPAEVLIDVSGDQQVVHDLLVDGITDADQLEQHVESTGKKKRGRPPNLQKCPEVGQQKGGQKLAKSPEVTERNGGVTAEDMALGEVVLPVVVGLEATKVDGSLSNKEKIGVDKQIFNGLADTNGKSSSKIEVYTAKKDKLRSKKGKQISDGKQETASLKRGRRTLNIDARSPNQDPKGLRAGKNTEVNGKDSLVNEAETPTIQLPFNMSDDEPLSMWLEAPKTADATSASQGRNVEKQCTTNCIQDIVIRSSQCNDQILPFVKSCPLWETIESMHAFRLFPQNPHFRTLFSKKDSSREGLAIALMVHFVNVVEKTSTLQPDSPRGLIEDILETVFELEDDGFDVNVLRDHLMKVLLTKDKRDELEAKAKEGTELMEEETKKAEDLNNHLRLLQERKAESESTIAHLKSTVNGINESIRDVDLEFRALVAAAPWQVG